MERDKELKPIKRKVNLELTEFRGGALEMDGYGKLTSPMKMWLLNRIIKDLRVEHGKT